MSNSEAAENQRAFYERHPEKRKEYQQAYRERHPEKIKEHQRRGARVYKKRHPEKVRKVHGQLMKKRNAATAGKASHNKLWTFEDIDKCFSVEKTDRELSEELGRSIYAIRTARTTNKARAPEGWQPKGTKRINDEETTCTES